jgi:two-component system, NtrC family, response regulator AtoC
MPPAKTIGKVGLVESNLEECSRIAAALRQAGFEVLEANDYDGAYEMLRERQPDVLLLEVKSSPQGIRECLDLLKELGESELDTAVIILSGDRTKSTALRVLHAGAYDYLLKPADSDVLRIITLRAIEKLQIEREHQILREELRRKDALGDLLGSTDAMKGLFDSIRRVARTSTTVVIRGESGSGKELVARAIHDNSQRRDRPFVPVNCAALPETLMEAELFGYEKGAFTGAVATKEGRIELARHGTLFLDEIGTLSLPLQSKLLRVLDEHALTRLGGTRSIKVDFRLISATNEDLEKLVRERRFREDLYYRIHVLTLFVPPLRERVDDIPLIVDYFIKVYCAANHWPPKRVADEAMEAMKRYPWPGNVRELENLVQRMVVMTDEDEIPLKQLPRDIREAASQPCPDGFCLPSSGIRLEEEVKAFERRWVETALKEAKGVKVEAARLLGLNKDKLKYLCRKYEI